VHQPDEHEAHHDQLELSDAVDRVQEERHGVELRDERRDGLSEAGRRVEVGEHRRHEVLEVPRPLVEHRGEDGPAEDAPRVRAGPADDERNPDEERHARPEEVRRHRALRDEPEDAGEPHERAAEHERLDFEPVGVLAEGVGHVLVLADGLQHATERRLAGALEQPVERRDEPEQQQPVDETVDDGFGVRRNQHL
jgi:hypothetical protein